MNSFQRVMNTLQGLPADRTPVFAVLGTWGARLAGTDLKTLYSSADHYVEAQKQIQDLFGLDLVLASFDYSLISEVFGCEIAWFADQAPNLRRPLACSMEEARKLPLPEPGASGRLPMVLEATRRLSALYQGQVPLIAALPGPCALPILIFGLEAWLEAVLFDYPHALAFLRWSSDFLVSWANALLGAGVNALVLTEAMAASEIMTRRLFEDKLLPHDREVFARIQGPIVFHHTGGQITHVLDLLPGLPNLAGVVVGSKDRLSLAREILGDQVAIVGNLDNLSMPAYTPDEAYRRGRACLDSMTGHPRYVLSHSGADLPLRTPPENIHALRAASIDQAEGLAGPGGPDGA